MEKIADLEMQNIMNFTELNKTIKECKNCKLHETRIHALCGEGNKKAKMMLIAQAPGKEEDKSGKMFIGPSGKIFHELLKKANINKEAIYLTNLIKCYLPKCRRPSKNEIEQCTKYLDKEIEHINPTILVPVGFHATRYVFNKYGLQRPPKKEYTHLFGTVFQAGSIFIFPLRHPTALLFNPEKRDTMQHNYNKLMELLD